MISTYAKKKIIKKMVKNSPDFEEKNFQIARFLC